MRERHRGRHLAVPGADGRLGGRAGARGPDVRRVRRRRVAAGQPAAGARSAARRNLEHARRAGPGDAAEHLRSHRADRAPGRDAQRRRRRRCDARGSRRQRTPGDGVRRRPAQRTAVPVPPTARRAAPAPRRRQRRGRAQRSSRRSTDRPCTTRTAATAGPRCAARWAPTTRRWSPGSCSGTGRRSWPPGISLSSRPASRRCRTATSPLTRT